MNLKTVLTLCFSLGIISQGLCTKNPREETDLSERAVKPRVESDVLSDESKTYPGSLVGFIPYSPNLSEADQIHNVELFNNLVTIRLKRKDLTPAKTTDITAWITLSAQNGCQMCQVRNGLDYKNKEDLKQMYESGNLWAGFGLTHYNCIDEGVFLKKAWLQGNLWLKVFPFPLLSYFDKEKKWDEELNRTIIFEHIKTHQSKIPTIHYKVLLIQADKDKLQSFNPETLKNWKNHPILVQAFIKFVSGSSIHARQYPNLDKLLMEMFETYHLPDLDAFVGRLMISGFGSIPKNPEKGFKLIQDAATSKDPIAFRLLNLRGSQQ